MTAARAQHQRSRTQRMAQGGVKIDSDHLVAIADDADDADDGVGSTALEVRRRPLHRRDARGTPGALPNEAQTAHRSL